MRFLYLPNENDETDFYATQVGPRKAFRRLVELKKIERIEVFSYLHHSRVRGAETAKSELLRVAGHLKPDIIFWQHVGDYPIDDAYISELRRRSECGVLAYHDEDPFDPLVKRISSSMRAILKASDLVLISGTGPLYALYEANGAKCIRYIPHYYDNVRFDKPWSPTLQRNHKITMIGSCYHLRRIPFLYMPSGQKRARLARRLSHEYDRDFALFGTGWDDLRAARGSLPFQQQETAIRDSWISVNWDHFDYIPYYSSDRLPISLAAGVPHVTSHHPGYEELFAGCPGLYWAKTVPGAIALIQWLLSRPKEVLIEEGLGAQAWVRANQEADIVFERAFDLCLEMLNARNARNESRASRVAGSKEHHA